MVGNVSWGEGSFVSNRSFQGWRVKNSTVSVASYPALTFFLKKVRFGANPLLHLSAWPASINSLSMVGIGKSAIAASNA
jgi:hypothetical protein